MQGELGGFSAVSQAAHTGMDAVPSGLSSQTGSLEGHSASPAYQKLRKHAIPAAVICGKHSKRT